jgi:hypothetical protein
MRIDARRRGWRSPGRREISAGLIAPKPLAYRQVGRTLIRPQTRWCLIDVVAFVFCVRDTGRWWLGKAGAVSPRQRRLTS